MSRYFFSPNTAIAAICLVVAYDASGNELLHAADCKPFASSYGYVVMTGSLAPARGPEGSGEIVYDFGNGNIKTGRVTVDILTLPAISSAGSISLKLKFQDEFSDNEKLTWIVDAHFTPTDVPLTYNVSERFVLASGAGLWQNAYFGSGRAKSLASFATQRIELKYGAGVLCGLDG